MEFWSTITELCFYFLLCQLVSSSRYILLQKGTLSEKNSSDDLFEKFFVYFNKVYLEKHKPRDVMVIATLGDDLQQAKPLFNSLPCMICKETEICALHSQRFSQDSFVVIFLEDLSKETFEKNIKILSDCRRCRVLFTSKGVVHANDIWFILTLAVEHRLPYSKFAHHGKGVIELYTDFIATNCTMQVRLVTVWKPGVSSDGIIKWALQSRDMNRCPVSVSTLDFSPKMMIEPKENGSLKIVGGREGELLLAVAEKLNFTIALRYPSMEDQLEYSRRLSILNDVASGISEIGIGRLRPTNHLNRTIALSVIYDEECATWGVPHVMRWSSGTLWVEFSWQVWAVVGTVFAAGCLTACAHKLIVTPKNNESVAVRNEEKNTGFIRILLDVVAVHLGNPVVHVSSCARGKFMLIAYLYYATVITTAYKTSLASILATDERTPKIVDAQGIVDSNLKVGGSLHDYKILSDQANDSQVTRKLLKRFVVDNNNSMPWDVLFDDQDTAYLGRSSSLIYERQMMFKAQERVTFDVLNGCVLSYPTVIAFQSRSFLHKPVNDIIYRLLESGIVKHWDIDEIDTDEAIKQIGAKRYFEDRASNKFDEIFIFYSACIAASLLTFFAELLTSRLDSKKPKRSVNEVHNTFYNHISTGDKQVESLKCD